MRGWKRVGASSLGDAVVLCLAFGGGALAQTSQSKGATGEAESLRRRRHHPGTTDLEG